MRHALAPIRRGAALLRALAPLALALAACDGGSTPDEACPDTPGTICTWAGTGEAAFDGDGNALLASDFYWPIDVTFTEAGEAYILDWNNHRVRLVTPEGTLRTVIGTDFVGDGPEDKADLTPEGADGTTVTLNHPTQLVAMPDGSMLLVSWHNHKLRRYDPGTGKVRVTCGGPAGFKGDGGPASKALLDQPIQAALAKDGTLFLLDQRNQVIRRIGTDDVITTVAGTPREKGYAGDGGKPLEAKMQQPFGSNPQPGGGLAIDEKGRLYFSDVLNHRVRRVDLEKDLIETVAGNGEAGYGGDGGPGTSAKLNNPRKLAFGPDGRLYIADERNHRVRALDVETGTIETVAGNGAAAFGGDGGPATAAALNRPSGLAFHDGFLYIADTENHRIRRIKLEVTP